MSENLQMTQTRLDSLKEKETCNFISKFKIVQGHIKDLQSKLIFLFYNMQQKDTFPVYIYIHSIDIVLKFA